MPALFTGRLPPDAGSDDPLLPLLDDHPQNLFTLFGASHDVHAHESVTQLCPSTLCVSEEGGTLPSLIDDAVDVWWRFSSVDEPEEEK